MFLYINAGGHDAFCLEREAEAVKGALSAKGISVTETAAPETPDRLVFFFHRAPGTSRDSFRVNDPLLLVQETESAAWLSSPELRKAAGADRVSAVLPETVR